MQLRLPRIVVDLLGRDEMDASVLETAFLAAQEGVGRQGDVVRSLKAQLKDGKVERVSPSCQEPACLMPLGPC